MAAADKMNDEEWADYLTGVLKRLSDLADQLPKDAPLHELIEETCEPLGVLIGWFVGGAENTAVDDTQQEMERLKTFKTASKQIGL